MDLTTEITSLLDQLVEQKQPEQIDSVQLFINQHLVPNIKGKATLGDTHRAYLKFCADNGYNALPMYYFPSKLREKGFTVTNGRGNKHWVRDHFLV